MPIQRPRAIAQLGMPLTLLGLSLAACDGVISIEGRVYGREAAAGRPGEAHIDSDTPLTKTAGLVPLAGATVWLVHDPADTVALDRGKRRDIWADSTSTSPYGGFSTGSVTQPGAFTALLRVRHPDYVGLDVPFRHGDTTHHHRAMVILEPKPRPQPSRSR